MPRKNISCLLFLFCWGLSSCFGAVTEEYRVVIDPGHGGTQITINGKLLKSERWDPVTQSYLSYYNTGMRTKKHHEHLVVLALAKRLRYYLDLTNSPWGWLKFTKLIEKFSVSENEGGTPAKRVIFRTKLTRTDSWNHRYVKADHLAVNNSYRLYDYPDQRGRMRKGRLSFINHYSPSLVVSLHTTPAPRGQEGGMAAVLSPGFATFNMARKIQYKELKPKVWQKSLWNGKILATERGWDQFSSLLGDSWGYFHGYRSNRRGTKPNFKAARGIRHNLISWFYKESEHWEKNYAPNQPGPYALRYKDFIPRGKFWERERSQAEKWRREGGLLGFGGDNHFAADELMRFVQYGMRLLYPDLRTGKKIGKIHPPFASSYALPIYVNAISAYLEIGYLNRKKDRHLLMKRKDAVAQSLAVGIYSLYTGVTLRPSGHNPYPPRSLPLDFEKYRKLPDGDYFKRSRPHSLISL